MSTSDVKQLIVVAEGTAALGPYWQTIFSDYLEKIIRSLCGTELNGERNPISNVDLSLVTFNCHGSYSGCLVQRSGWTKDVDTFLRWLSNIPFAGGGFNDVAIAEGLADALMMFSSPSSQAQPSNNFKRHCILITYSNPHTLPTPVYLPRLQTVEQNGPGKSELRLSDAKTVASYFSRFSVSLSVVCPRKLPMIKDLYNAANLSQPSVDLSIDNAVKNKFYLILISENFVEARTALSHSASNPMEVDRAIVAPSLPVIAEPPANIAILNPQPVSDEPVPVEPVPTAILWNPVKVKMRATVAPSLPVTGQPPAPMPSCSSPDQALFPHNPSVAQPATQAIPSASPVSQDMVTNAENVGGMTQPLRAGPSGGANVNLLNNLSQVETSATLAGAASSVGQSEVAMHMSNQISTGMATSLHPSETVFSSRQQGITSMVPASVGQSPGSYNSFCPQTISKVASNLGVSQRMPWMNQGSHSGGQTSGLSQGNVPFIKFWEGTLSGKKKEQSVLVTKLLGFRSASASASLAADWPPTIQIDGITSRDHVNKLGYVGQSDALMFQAMSQHKLLGELQDMKLCAVIKLPSQTLLLYFDDNGRLMGKLFLGIPNQQQQQQQQQQQLLPQQQQQMSQLQQQQHQFSHVQHHQQQQQQQSSPLKKMQQQSSPLKKMQQQTSPLNQMQQQPQQIVGPAVMGGQALAQAPGRSQQGGGGGQQPTMPGADFMP